MNIYPINNKIIFWRNIYLIEKKEEKKWYFFNFKSDSEQDPDPLIHETDSYQNETDPRHCYPLS